MKEKKEFSFLCINCCNISSINFDVIANRETIKLIKSGNSKKGFITCTCTKGENEALFNELQLRELEERHKEFLEKLKKLKLQ